MLDNLCSAWTKERPCTSITASNTWSVCPAARRCCSLDFFPPNRCFNLPAFAARIDRLFPGGTQLVTPSIWPRPVVLRTTRLEPGDSCAAFLAYVSLALAFIQSSENRELVAERGGRKTAGGARAHVVSEPLALSSVC